MAAAASRFSALRAVAERAPHGTNARYSVGCRCRECRLGRSAYERNRLYKNNGHGRTVSTEQAREHLLRLQALGIGYLTVSEACDVNHNILWGILKGQRPQARYGTVQRILAVDQSCARDGNRIPAGETWKILDGLLHRGFSRTQLAYWLGFRGKSPALQLPPDYVTALNAARVKRLAALMDAGKVERGKPCLPPVKPRGMNKGKKKPAPHGTYGRYSSGCRCDLCVVAGRDYKRQWKRNRKAAA